MIDLAILPPPLHFWRCRLAAGASWSPVVSFFGPPLVEGELLDRSPRFQAVVRLETSGRAITFGDECPIEVDPPVLLRNLERIERADWLYLRDHADYATKHAPHMPDARPTQKIDPRGRSVF